MTNIEKLITILVKPFQAVEKAFQDLLLYRSIEHGFGDALDVIGRYVRQPRGDLIDADYKRYLSARVATNRSTGKREELIRIARLILGTTDGTVWLRTRGNATLILEINDLAVDSTTSDALILFLGAAVADGVRIVVVTSTRPLAETFRFDSGPGFDQGHLARGDDNLEL